MTGNKFVKDVGYIDPCSSSYNLLQLFSEISNLIYFNVSFYLKIALWTLGDSFQVSIHSFQLSSFKIDAP